MILGAPPVERTASGPALAEQLGVPSAFDVFDRGEAAAAADVIQRGSAQLGQALAWLVNALDPELIVVGGGLGLRDVYRLAAVEAMRPLVEWPGDRSVEVVPAALGTHSVAVGAALLASDRATRGSLWTRRP
jgi:glucokinase